MFRKYKKPTQRNKHQKNANIIIKALQNVRTNHDGIGDFSKLGIDCTILVAERLDLTTLANLAQTSKAFHELAKTIKVQIAIPKQINNSKRCCYEIYSTTFVKMHEIFRTAEAKQVYSNLQKINHELVQFGLVAEDQKPDLLLTEAYSWLLKFIGATAATIIVGVGVEQGADMIKTELNLKDNTVVGLILGFFIITLSVLTIPSVRRYYEIMNLSTTPEEINEIDQAISNLITKKK